MISIEGNLVEHPNNGLTPLQICVAFLKNENSLKVFKLLVDNGANIFELDSEKSNLIYYAAFFNNKMILEYLFENYNFDIMAKNDDGKTALDAF